MAAAGMSPLIRFLSIFGALDASLPHMRASQTLKNALRPLHRPYFNPEDP
jgi:hypothetical protein